MNIHNFESKIEQKILDRGFDYYEQDQVESFDHFAQGEFAVTVLGSERYSVYIELNSKLKIVEHSCDCPYDWGDFCKHEVAVLHWIRDSQVYLEKPNEAGEIGLIKKEISVYNASQLRTIIMDLVKQNRKCRKEVLWQLGYESEEESY